MAGGNITRVVMKYGMRYGPLVFEAVKHGREPAQRAIENALARNRERRRAIQHAAAVVEGSVLRVFHDGDPVWVVFSNDVPVASYPKREVGLDQLLEYADLDQRQPVDRDALRPLPDRMADKLPDPVRQVARRALRRGNARSGASSADREGASPATPGEGASQKGQDGNATGEKDTSEDQPID